MDKPFPRVQWWSRLSPGSTCAPGFEKKGRTRGFSYTTYHYRPLASKEDFAGERCTDETTISADALVEHEQLHVSQYVNLLVLSQPPRDPVSFVQRIKRPLLALIDFDDLSLWVRPPPANSLIDYNSRLTGDTRTRKTRSSLLEELLGAEERRDSAEAGGGGTASSIAVVASSELVRALVQQTTGIEPEVAPPLALYLNASYSSRIHGRVKLDIWGRRVEQSVPNEDAEDLSFLLVSDGLLSPVNAPASDSSGHRDVRDASGRSRERERDAARAFQHKWSTEFEAHYAEQLAQFSIDELDALYPDGYSHEDIADIASRHAIVYIPRRVLLVLLYYTCTVVVVYVKSSFTRTY